MSESQELTVREKQELAKKEEQTVPGRYFVPSADIFETDDALTVILEMPGVEKNDISVALEDDYIARRRQDRLLEIPRHGASLYRIYRRTLRPPVRAVGKDRS